MRGFVDAVTFLTRVPAGAEVRDEDRIADAVPWFPVVGAVVGAVVAAVYAGLIFALPPFAAAAVAVGCGVLLTGAFPEDGLADVADAFGGGRDREDVLRILKDPRLGTFGVLAVVLSVLIRVASLAALTRRDALVALPAAHALSRAAAVGAMTGFRPVSEGLGASYARALSTRNAVVGLSLGALIAAFLVGFDALPAIAVAAIAAVLIGYLARRKIGGISGDVLGAVEQAAEIGLFLLFAALTS